MLACVKCLENNWVTTFKEGWVLGECLNCGNEIQFPASGRAKKSRAAGDPCDKCNHPLIFKESRFKEKKRRQKYWFTGFLKCIKCKTIYMDEKFKVQNPDQIAS